MENVLPQVVKPKRMTFDLLFPQWYLCCRKGGSFLCHSRHWATIYKAALLFPKCSNPRQGDSLCTGCVCWQAKIDGIRPPFQFDSVISEATHQLIYIDLEALAMPLFMLSKDHVVTNPIPWEFILLAPQYWKRLIERSYNPSCRLVRELAKPINLPLLNRYPIRWHYTPPQAQTATVDERRSNLADAFTYRNHRLKDKQMFFMGDDFTSEATSNNCAMALKSTGVSSVWGLFMVREICKT